MILLLGVGIATVSDVELRPLGFAFGILAVLSTAMFQVTKQPREQGTWQDQRACGGRALVGGTLSRRGAVGTPATRPSFRGHRPPTS